MMTCTQCRDLLSDMLEGLIDDAVLNRVKEHLDGCPECRAEHEQITDLRTRIALDAAGLRQTDMRDATASRLIERPVRSNHWVSQLCLRWGVGLSAAAALLLLVVWLAIGNGTASAAEILADAVKATTGLRSVHLSAVMRTEPRDNFELITLEGELVPLQMWKRFGDDVAWRVEKPGRVVAMRKGEATLWIKPDDAMKAPSGAGFVGWVGFLMDVDQVLEHEISMAKLQGSKLSRREITDASGRQQLEVTVEAKAQGNYGESDWLKNTSVADSDNRRVYRFDPQSKRLEGLEVHVHAQGKDILVFAIRDVQYNVELSEDTFTLALPSGIRWMQLPSNVPLPAKFANMGPEQIARAFFEALSEQRWDDACLLMPVQLDDGTKRAATGLQVISIGKPVKSGLYPGVFVPYEIRFSSGETKKFNLALRNDNSAKRWYVDGGF